MKDLQRIINKIERHRDTGTHSNNDYCLFEDLIEELTSVSNRLEKLVIWKRKRGCRIEY